MQTCDDLSVMRANCTGMLLRAHCARDWER
jgi:hypothetical protein